MADEGYVIGQLAGISNDSDRKILENIFRVVLRETRFGEPSQRTKLTNFSAIYQGSTTATSTSEFSIQHGMAAVPRLAIPVLNLNQVGSRVPDVQVTRVADGKRIYLKTEAGSTNAVFWMIVE